MQAAVEILALGRAAAGAVAWRLRGQLHLSIVVKARFAILPGGEMFAEDPEDVFKAELHHDGAPNRSVRATSDLVPFLSRCDVTFVGRAHAPPGPPVVRMPVRVAIEGGDAVILDKTLLVQGEIKQGAAQPFTSIPLTYERAFGGPGFDANPLGMGFPLRGGEVPPHNVSSPYDALATAGFAPVSRAWPLRKRLLGSVSRKVLDGPIAEIPDEFDWSYFQSAPLDQRIPYLRGDEWIVLEGLHPELSIVRSRLPDATAGVRVFGLDQRDDDQPAVVQLRADTFRIDGEARACSLAWRGIVPIRDPSLLAALRVVAGVATRGRPIAWPSTRPLGTRGPTALADTDVSDLLSTLTYSEGAPTAPIETMRAAQSSGAARPFFGRRTTTAIRVVTRAPIVAFTIPWQMRAGRDTRTVVVKTTCDLVPDAPARLSSAPAAATADLFAPSGALVHATDFALFKPRVDVTLLGHAQAIGAPLGAVMTALRFGRGANRFERSVAVFGDRTWDATRVKLTATASLPFRAMPLVYERAYGGPAFSPNPAGRGHGRVDGVLPNLEDPAALLSAPSDSAPPACFGPISPIWASRSAKLAGVDPDKLAVHRPVFPSGFDWTYFQAAPAAQQVDRVEGDEPFELVGMHSERAVVSGTLPSVRARAFAQRTSAAGGSFIEIAMRLDTISFDLDGGKLHLLWRGLLEVTDADASDVAEIYVLLERLDASARKLDAARDAYDAARTMTPRTMPIEEPTSEIDASQILEIVTRDVRKA